MGGWVQIVFRREKTEDVMNVTRNGVPRFAGRTWVAVIVALGAVVMPAWGQDPSEPTAEAEWWKGKCKVPGAPFDGQCGGRTAAERHFDELQ